MTVLPAVLTFKVSIDAGKKAHLGGYLISTGRSVKTGDSIAVFVLSGVAVLSVEAAEPKSGGSAEPWFTAFKEDAKPSIDPAAAVKVWRVEKEYVRR